MRRPRARSAARPWLWGRPPQHFWARLVRSAGPGAPVSSCRLRTQQPRGIILVTAQRGLPRAAHVSMPGAGHPPRRQHGTVSQGVSWGDLRRTRSRRLAPTRRQLRPGSALPAVRAAACARLAAAASTTALTTAPRGRSPAAAAIAAVIPGQPLAHCGSSACGWSTRALNGSRSVASTM